MITTDSKKDLSQDKNLNIVAIVAIVGIVAIVLGFFANKSDASSDLFAEENLVGQAAETLSNVNCNDLRNLILILSKQYNDNSCDKKDNDLCNSLRLRIVILTQYYRNNCQTLECTDSDGGLDYYKFGEVKAEGDTNYRRDSCSDTWVIEEFCRQDVLEMPPTYDCDKSNGACQTKLECPNGCLDGACIPNFNIGTTSDDSSLKFKDGNNNLAKMPLFFSNQGILKLGDNNDDLIVNEELVINKDDYFVLTAAAYGKTSFALRYRGADKITSDAATIKFQDLGSGNIIERPLSYGTEVAQLKLGNNTFSIFAESNTSLNDFDISVDLNADALKGGSVDIVDATGASMSIGSRNEDFALEYSGSDDINLGFRDNAQNFAKPPLFHSLGNILKLGDNDDDLIVNEGKTITKNDYFIVTGSDSGSYALRYRGADKVTVDNPVIKFDDLGSGDRIERLVSVSKDGEVSQIKLGGNTFRVFSASSIEQNDFDINIDLNGNGILDNSTVLIVENSGKSLLIG